jgi:hypothetical protein
MYGLDLNEKEIEIFTIIRTFELRLITHAGAAALTLICYAKCSLLELYLVAILSVKHPYSMCCCNIAVLRL